MENSRDFMNEDPLTPEVPEVFRRFIEQELHNLSSVLWEEHDAVLYLPAHVCFLIEEATSELEHQIVAGHRPSVRFFPGPENGSEYVILSMTYLLNLCRHLAAQVYMTATDFSTDDDLPF